MVGAGGVGIPSNLFISSGCLGLSGLNLTDCACGGGRGGASVGFGGTEHPASGGLVHGSG